MAQPFKPAVVSVGDELVMGERRDDENLRWMCAMLRERETPARVAVTIGDDVGIIAEHVGGLYKTGYRPILVSGGIGSMDNDHTREGVAAALGLPLEMHNEYLKLLHCCYRRLGLEFTEEGRRMAQLPAGAVLVPNPKGVPGFSVAGRIFAFPGFPRMLRPMLLTVLDRLVPTVAERQWLVEEKLLPVNQGSIARQVEAFSASLAALGSTASVVVCHSNVTSLGRVKLVLRREPDDDFAHQRFAVLVEDLHESSVMSRL
mmetsp:Transcript_32730/g.100596  ORF Transcript_32730/g.100596 Transcript_32730/m.100596 type:complete len:259 (+) Transcript_32730:81-857(+)